MQKYKTFSYLRKYIFLLIYYLSIPKIHPLAINILYQYNHSKKHKTHILFLFIKLTTFKDTATYISPFYIIKKIKIYTNFKLSFIGKYLFFFIFANKLKY